MSSERKLEPRLEGGRGGRMTTEMEDETMKLERLNEKFEEQ